MIHQHHQSITLILLTFILSFPQLSAQMRRVAMGAECHSTCGDASVTVYEFNAVDEKPRFQGGEDERLKFINSERRYPSQAYKQRVQGRVLCGFVVNVDGSISNVTVVRGVEDSLNREAVRIIQEMPRWEAGKINGQPVPVYCVIPIPFRL